MRKIIAAFALVFASATVAQTPAPTTLTFDPPILSFTAVVGGPAFEATVQITNNTGQNFIIESIETSGYPPFRMCTARVSNSRCPVIPAK